jgi:hypothetical protein
MLKEKSKAKQQKTLYLKEQKQEFKNIFEKLGIEYSELSADEIDAYKRKWVDAFSPNDTDKKEIKKQHKLLKDVMKKFQKDIKEKNRRKVDYYYMIYQNVILLKILVKIHQMLLLFLIIKLISLIIINS